MEGMECTRVILAERLSRKKGLSKVFVMDIIDSAISYQLFKEEHGVVSRYTREERRLIVTERLFMK